MLKHEDTNNKVDYKNIIISDLGKIVEKSEDDSNTSPSINTTMKNLIPNFWRSRQDNKGNT